MDPKHARLISVIALIIANLFPIIGLAFFGWQVSTIIFVYWLENIVIGAWNVVRMGKAQGKAPRMKFTVNGKPAEQVTRRSLINFFILHYGFFTLGHGVFVLALFGLPQEGFAWVGLTFVLLFVSHGVSYLKNFIQSGEYLTVAHSDLFVQPYRRIVVLHVVVILSGFWIEKGRVGPGAVYLLVGLKTFVDIIAHLLERRKLRGRLG
jgi:hypothetical protein